MCLLVDIEAEAMDSATASSLARRHAILHPGERGQRLSVHGCDLLSDDADWDAATWDLTQTGREQLGEALRAVFADVPGEITVQALWDGDRPTIEQTVTRDELVAAVRGNELGTKTRYRVRA